MTRAIAEFDFDVAAVDEIGLLLALVVVSGAGVARWQDEGVDAEGAHPELATDLAKAIALTHRVDTPDCIRVSLHHLKDPLGFGHPGIIACVRELFSAR